jgi:DNA mismatch repair ATPase MutL
MHAVPKLKSKLTSASFSSKSMMTVSKCNSTQLEIYMQYRISISSFHDIFVGVGICYKDLRDVAGEWNSTSKRENGSSHGFRGEALAATRTLSSMTITSKTGDCRSTYLKSFLKNEDNAGDDCSEITLSSTAIARSGTKVKVWHLFEGLPARRKAMRPNTEMIRVKEFVQRMSILYHDVDWLLIDERTGKTIMKLEVRPSVSARFSVFHGQQIQHKMKVTLPLHFLF